MSNLHQIALVLGMHRSGTSALAALISRLGFEVGKNLLPGNEFNAGGYYENEKLVRFHGEIFERLGSSWHDLRFLPESAFQGGWIDDAAQTLSGILQEEFGDASRIVVKDPRAARLLPVWHRLAQERALDLRFILIGRHPMQVSYSLAHRDAFSRQKSLLLWLQYNLVAERGTRTGRRLILRFQELMARPEEMARQLASFLEVESMAELEGAAAAIDSSFAHHLTETENYSEQPEIQQWTATVWKTLFLRRRVSDAAEKRLDRLAKKIRDRLSVLPDEAGGLGDYKAAYLRRAMSRKEAELVALKERFQEQKESLQNVMRQRDEARKKEELAAAASSFKDQELIVFKERHKERTATLEAVMLHRDEARKELAAKIKEHAATSEAVMLHRDEARKELAAKIKEHTATLEAVMLHRDEARKELAAKIKEHTATLEAVMRHRDEARKELAAKIKEHTATLEAVMRHRDEARKELAANVALLALRDEETKAARRNQQQQAADLQKVRRDLRDSESSLQIYKSLEEKGRERCKAMEDRVKELGNVIKEQERDLHNTVKDLRDAESALERQQGQASELQERISNLKRSESSLQDKLETVHEQMTSAKEKRALAERVQASTALKIVERESESETLRNQLEALRHDWTALPLRARLKKLAGTPLSRFPDLVRVNAVTPAVWNYSAAGFSFGLSVFPDLASPGNYLIEGWLVARDKGLPMPSLRLINEAGQKRGGAKRGRRRVDLPFLLEKDDRVDRAGFAFLKLEGFEKCRLEARTPTGQWVALALIDLPGVGWQHFHDVDEIVLSQLFDYGWYARRYDLTDLDRPSLISHYLREGAAQGLWPNPLFATTYYYESNPEICATGENPLLAYLRAGKEGKPRKPNSWFEPIWYSNKNPEVTKTKLDPLCHYLLYGKRGKLSPGPGFDVAAYLRRNRDVALSTLDPLAHFIHYGASEGRRFPRPGDTIHWIHEVEPAPDRVNVLLVGHVLGNKMFGSERSLLELIQMIDRDRFNVYCSFPQSEQSFIDRIKPFVTGVAIFPYRWWSGASTDNDGYDCDFEEVMRSRRIALVHVNSIVLRDPLIAAKRLKIPSILHLREIITLDPDLAARIGLPAEEIAVQVRERSEFVIANSHFTLDQHGAVDRSFVLYNTADEIALDLPVRERGSILRVGMLSSNLPKKGLEGFFSVARASLERAEPLEFWLVGPETEWVQQHCKANGGCPPNVHCTGYLATPREALVELDVVINLSTFAESFGRSVGEGMLARRPAVVYDYGALPELVRDGVDGFVVPYRDIGAALDRLARLAREPGLVKQMGEAARARALEMFSREVGARSLRHIYDSVLSAAQNGSEISTETENGMPPVSEARKALRIGYFLWHFPVPSETFVLNELRYLVERGYDVRVFCRQSPFRAFQPDFPVHFERVDSVEDLAQKLLLSEREVIHSHFVFPTVTKFLWPACEAAEIPFTFIAHAQDIFRYENAEKNRLGEIARSKWCRAVFAPGTFHRRLFIEQGVPAEKIVINPQSIPLGFFRRDAGHEFKAGKTRSMCAIHRFVEKKGLEHAIRAAAHLTEKGIALYLYGYGPLHDPLRALAAELKADNVHFPGELKERAEVVEALHKHDLFLAPSLRATDGDMDGVPTVLMEAMACGTPVVASNVSSLPDLVQEGITGYVCAPGNTESLIDAILRFYSDPVSKVEAIKRRAREAVLTSFNIEKSTRTLTRIWSGEGIDIILVTHNNLPELQEVVRRVFRFTSRPFRLCIVDNKSDEETREYLRALAAERSNVQLELLEENVFVGPGTNKGLELGDSPIAVYLCSKEGFILQPGWDQKVLEFMETHPRVGLAGTMAHSPSYLTGRDYLQNLERFSQFREQEFARSNPDRIFAHIQGGVIAIRRAMFDEIGGFSREVPHQHTDVEYSYYVESRGWELGDIAGVKAYYVKTLPPMTAHLTERVEVLHPGSLEKAPLFDAVASRETEFCNVCAQAVDFERKGDGLVCPNCEATPFHRSLYRSIAESTLPYRRLPALYVSDSSGLSSLWERMFQGPCMTYDEATAAIDASGRLELATGGRDVVVLEVPASRGKPADSLMSELSRLLKSDGTLFYTQSYGMNSLLEPHEADVFETAREVAEFLNSLQFDVRKQVSYGSSTVCYLDRDIFVAGRSSS